MNGPVSGALWLSFCCLKVSQAVNTIYSQNTKIFIDTVLTSMLFCTFDELKVQFKIKRAYFEL